MTSPNWQRLGTLFETIGFGEVRVVVKDGEPIRAEIIIKSVRLDSPEEFEDRLKLIQL